MPLKKLFLLIWCVGFFDFSCSFITLESQWYINWKFKNIADSSSVRIPLTYKILELGSTVYGVYKDTMKDSGNLVAWITVEEQESKFLAQNPKLQVQLFKNTMGIFDTTLSWQEAEFVTGKDPWGYTNNVSNKTIYIDTSHVVK